MRTLPTIAALLCLAAAPLAAHDPGLSSATLWLQQQRLTATLTFAPADLETLLPMDLDGDGQVSDAEFQQTRAVLERFAKEGVQVSLDGELVGPVDSSVERTQDQRGRNIEIQLRFPTRSGAGWLSLRNALLPDLPAGHRHYVTLFDESANLVGETLLDPENNVFEVSLQHSNGAASSRSFGEFFVLGVEHIVTGYDHLLFLLGLLVVGGTFASAAKIITSFTVAHSITLGLATFGVVQLPPALVEPLIAASIAYVGLENIVRRNLGRRWLLTFVFGLVHGLGFASVLRELGAGANGGSSWGPLLAFNLGVETGQIGIAAIALPLIMSFSKQPRLALYLRPTASVVAVALGTWWLIARVAGI
jgi:hydrogenase/urease accessory protein HupE